MKRISILCAAFLLISSLNVKPGTAQQPPPGAAPGSPATLEQRVASLERQIAELLAELRELRRQQKAAPIERNTGPFEAVKGRKALAPEQVENTRPRGEITVTFRVEEAGLQYGAIRVGDPPYRPISLETTIGLKERRSKLSVVLVGEALTQIHHLGIANPVAYFQGKSIEATGKVQYINLPRIMRPDGTVEFAADSYTYYQLVVESLGSFRIVE